MLDRFNVYNRLESFQEVKLTHREIDIVTCMLNGFTSKKSIGNFLSIEPRTAETHVRNLIHKLRCSSWEHVRDQFSTSSKVVGYRHHFDFLKLQKDFIQELNKTPKEQKPLILMLYDQQTDKQLLEIIKQIKDYIEHTGCYVALKKKQEEHLIPIKNKNNYLTLINISVSDNCNDISYNAYKSVINIIFCENNHSVPKKDPIIFSSDYNNLLHLTIAILTRIFPNSLLSQKVDVFSKYPLENLNVVSLPSNLKAFKDVPLQRRKIFKSFVVIACIGIITLIGYLQFAGNYTINSVQLIPEDSILLRREEIIKCISKAFKISQKKQTVPAVVLIGVGGAGKTTLARLWCKQNNQHNIIWEINAETPASLKNSFKELATAFAINPTEKEQLSLIESMQDSPDKDKKRLSFIQKHLQKTGNWILIFDNVVHLKDLSLYFPQNPKIWGNTGKVIITTRNAHFKAIDYIPSQNVVTIGTLSEKEGLLLFEHIINKYDPKHSAQQSQEVLKFLKAIPPLPLDISLAAKYIVNYKISFAEYLDKIKIHNRLFTDELNTLITETSEYTKTRNSIIALAVDQITKDSPELLELLLMASSLYSEQVPLDLLINLADKDLVTHLVQKLEQSSLCIKNLTPSNYNVISFHHSVQENIHAYLKSQTNPGQYSRIIELVINVLAKSLNTSINNQNGSYIRLLLPHSEFFAQQHLPLNLDTSLYIAIGGSYYELGEDLKAIEYLEKNIKKMKSDNKSNSLDFARASSYLGIIAMRRGDFKNSRSLLAQSIPIYKKSSDLTGYIRTLVFSGHLYTLIDHYQESEEMFDLSIDLCKNKNLESTNFPRALVFLGILYREMGQYTKAISVTEDSIKVYKSGIPHMWALAYLGSIELEVGNYTTAKDFLAKSIDFYKKNNASKHVSLGWILPTLGSIYRKIGQYNPALSLFNEAIEIFNSTNTETNKNLGTAFPLVHLGKLYRILGHYDKSKNILEDALKEHINIYGENNIRTKWVEMALSQLYLDMKQYENAKQIIDRCLTYYKSILSPTHPKIGKAYRTLGKCYMGLEDIETAQSLLEKSLTLITSHFKAEHLESAQTYKLLGDLSILQSNYEQAETYLEKARKIYEQHNHPDLYTCFESLGMLFLKKTKTTKDPQYILQMRNQAKSHIQKALVIVEKTFSEDSEHIKRLQQVAIELN